MNTQNQLTTTDGPAGSFALDPRSAFSGHTPGPWVLDYDKGQTRDILSLKHGGICAVRRAGRHDNATFAANARLIAAAPEMLRVVQLASDAVEAGAIDECYLSLLRDAIAALPNTRDDRRRAPDSAQPNGA